MDRTRFALVLLLSPAWLGVASYGEIAAQPLPLGPETRVDTLVRSKPNHPVIAVQRDGTFEIAWDYWEFQPASIFVRHFDAAGRPTSSAQVLLGSEGYFPQVDSIIKAGKGYDVLWHVDHDTGPAISFYTRHLDAGGVPLGEKPLKAGKPFLRYMWFSAGDGLIGGYYAAALRTLELRKVSPNGVPTLQQRRINTSELDSPTPFIQSLANGGFVAVIQGTIPDDTTQQVLRARLFDGKFEPVGPDFDLNTVPAGVARKPPFLAQYFAVAAAPDGGFGVAWKLGDTLYVRVFDAAGHAAAAEAAVLTTDKIIVPESLAFDSSGNLLLLWLEAEVSEPFRSDVQIQLFDRNGVALGPSEGVNSVASGRYQMPFNGSVAWANGSWLVTWQAEVEDLASTAIFVRRFAGH
ncbi:MAG TPA: hypothetical protein VF173_37510 [Thermoanaerobaculia bacterium]|nr:hypothetical protein [Thermoanaerobaculia bacterium]